MSAENSKGKQILEKLEEIARKFEVIDSIYLISSYFHPVAGRLGDIHIAIMPTRKLARQEHFDIIKSMIEVFGDNIHVVFMDEMPLYLQRKILQQGSLVYSKHKLR